MLTSTPMTHSKSSPRISRNLSGINFLSVAWALRVHDHLSLRGAAKELGVGHAALSRRISELEDALGVSLFERSPTGMRITNAGAWFFQRAGDALEQLDEALKRAGAAGKGEMGELNIGIVWSMGGGFLRDLLEVYAEKYPGVSIKLFEGVPQAEQISMVRRRRLDVAFVVNPNQIADCDLARLWTERLFAVLPRGHELCKRRAIGWNDLRDELFIIRRAACDPAFCGPVIKHLSDRGPPPEIQKVDVGKETLMHLVAMGRGVSITSEATRGTRYSGIVLRPISGGDETLQFSAVWSPRNDNPALRRLLSLARGRAKQVGHVRAPDPDVGSRGR
jgi:DNA-binding transcriptional LysR family regulator